MSESNRIIHPIAGILTAVFVLFGVGLATYYRIENNTARTEASKYYTKTAKYDADGLCSGPDNLRAIACLIEQIKTTRDEREAAYDLKAQQEMAEWAFAMLLATIAGVILVGLTLFETLVAGRELRRQNALALNATKAEFEPHFSRNNILNFRIVEQASRTPDEIKVVAVFDFVLTNVGKTSAYLVGRASAATLFVPRVIATETTRGSFLEEVTLTLRGLIAQEIVPTDTETIPFRFEFNVPKQNLRPDIDVDRMRLEIGIRIGFVDRFTNKKERRRVISYVYHVQRGEPELRGSFESIGDERDDPAAWNETDTFIPHGFYDFGILNKIKRPKRQKA